MTGTPRTVTAEEAEAIAERAATKGARVAISETFKYLGLDIADSEDIRNWHADRDYVRRARQGETDGSRAMLNLRNLLIVAGISGLIAWAQAHWPWATK